jgi:hypothetical protein
MSQWSSEKPPSETLVEVKDDERGIIRVRAIWGRDGTLPHWESEDRGILWSPNAFKRWRPIGSVSVSEGEASSVTAQERSEENTLSHLSHPIEQEKD